MIVKKRMANGKTKITSSLFADMRMFRDLEMKSSYESFKTMRKEPGANQRAIDDQLGQLKLANAVQEILLWKQACAELSYFVESLSNDQAKNYITDYGPSIDGSEEEE